MVEARRSDEWARHAHLLAAVRNAPHVRPTRILTAADFNPFASKPRPQTLREIFPYA